MSDTVTFPTGFGRIEPAAGVKILADDGTNPGYVDVSDLLTNINTAEQVGGDITGTASDAEITSIQGIAIAVGGGEAGQVLTYVGDQLTLVSPPTVFDAGFF